MTFDLAAGASLVLILSVIAVIDWRNHIIPDFWNVALALSGLSVTALRPFGDLVDAAAGMSVALVVSLGVMWGYSTVRGRQGLGLGDVKFLTASGAWTGVLGLPFLLLIASVSALAFTVGLHLSGRPVTAASRIAFGPHLAVGLLLTWISKSAGVM